MNDPAEAELWGGGVQFSTPRLHRLNFEFLGGEPSEKAEDGDDASEGKPSAEFILGFTRSSALRLGIEFGLRVEQPDQLRATGVYRTVFRLRPGSPESKDPEVAFQGIAARLAPTIVYPYLRELMSSLSQRALIAGFTLPIVQFGTVFNAEEIEIPAFIPESDDSGGPGEAAVE